VILIELEVHRVLILILNVYEFVITLADFTLHGTAAVLRLDECLVHISLALGRCELGLLNE
jgi:hypothetical protein